MASRESLVVLNHVSTILVYYTITIPSCQTISQYSSDSAKQAMNKLLAESLING